MRAEEMSAHLGKYVFLVVEGGRSFPCDVLRVRDGAVLAVEVNHDVYPMSLRLVPLASVVYVITAADFQRAEDDLCSGKWDEWLAPKDHVLGLPGGVAEFFGALRGLLNGEDALGHPLTKKKLAKLQKKWGTGAAA